MTPPRRKFAIGSNQYGKKPGRESTLAPPTPLFGGDFAVVQQRMDRGTAASREVLMDMLEALADFREAIVVIGAQAVHERTKNLVDLAPTATNDADVALDPTLVINHPTPLLGDVVAAAGFVRSRENRPGIYRRANTGDAPGQHGPTVDLIVPEAMAGAGRRGARLGQHGSKVAGRAQGIELAFLVNDQMELASFETNRPTIPVRVAGNAALLCAKAWKLADRIQEAKSRSNGPGNTRRGRIRPKDATDVWRIMCVSDPTEVRSIFDSGVQHPSFGEIIRLGRQKLIELFGDDGEGRAILLADLAMTHNGNAVADTLGAWINSFSAGD